MKLGDAVVDFGRNLATFPCFIYLSLKTLNSPINQEENLKLGTSLLREFHADFCTLWQSLKAISYEKHPLSNYYVYTSSLWFSPCSNYSLYKIPLLKVAF